MLPEFELQAKLQLERRRQPASFSVHALKGRNLSEQNQSVFTPAPFLSSFPANLENNLGGGDAMRRSEAAWRPSETRMFSSS